MRNLMIALGFILCLIGCDKAEQPPVTTTTTTAHEHVAPHGGLLAELGEHEAAAEMVLDRATGTLTLYVLDAHAENAVRIPQERIVTSVELGEGEPVEVILTPVASELTGEKAGDTSQFQGRNDALKRPGQIYVEVMELNVRNKKYEYVTFDFVP